MNTIQSKSDERKEFDKLCAEFNECSGVMSNGGGCGCTGRCLGSKLANLRKASDHLYVTHSYWYSDQLHGMVAKRPHDKAYAGAPLNAENYFDDVLDAS